MEVENVLKLIKHRKREKNNIVSNRKKWKQTSGMLNEKLFMMINEASKVFQGRGREKSLY